MLLRRVIQHVQAQNWFAVFIDFVIVVVGVFVGLQVQDWNDARKQRIEEQVLVVRLHEEVRSLIDANGSDLESLRLRGETLVGTNPVLFSPEPARALTQSECRHVAGSHAYRRPPDEIPLLDELLETGRFDVLSDPALKAGLRGYILLRERARAYYGEATNELFRLHSRYPELIQVSRLPESAATDSKWGGLSGDGYAWVPECDVSGMRSQPAFLNEYADNLSRINTLTQFTAQRQELLVQLEALLAAWIDYGSG